MKLFLDYKTTRKFAILIKYIPDTVKEISASVAYTQDDTLMKICNKKKIHLDWWGLFNSDISSKIEIVKEAIKSIISRKSGQKIPKIANLQYYKSKANYGTKKKGISR